MSNWYLIFLLGWEHINLSEITSGVIILSWDPENTAHYAQSTPYCTKNSLSVG